MAAELILGDIIFQDFEIPENFTIGGKQRLVIHTLPGGGRVVDAMGEEHAPIRWSGVFSGPQAAERVRQIEALRRSGKRQTFTWNAWRYDVIVESFDIQVTSSKWIPYSLQLCDVSTPAITNKDWLDNAKAPALNTPALQVAALETVIGAASLSLSASNIRQVADSAGVLAQNVTARAYGLSAS